MTNAGELTKGWLTALYAAAGPGALLADTPIETLQAVRDWRLIPALAPLVFAENEELARLAEQTVRRLLEQVPLARLPRLDREVRHSPAQSDWSARLIPGWRRLSPQGVTTRLGPTRLALASLHPNGWVRSSALKALSTSSPSEALRFALLRLSDWVPGLRVQAQDLCLATIAPGNEALWCSQVPLLEAVERSERAHLSELKGAVATLLETDAGQAALREATCSAQVEVRTFAFRSLLRSTATVSNSLLSRALLDAEPKISRFAIERLRSQPLSLEPSPVFREGFRSKDPLVRRHCLDALAELAGGEARALLLAGLVDSAGMVRGVAQFYAKRLEGFGDLTAFYLQQLTSNRPSRVAAAISGLTELRATSSWTVVAPFLDATSPRVRRAALSAAIAFGVPSTDAHLWAALVDAAPSVSRLARDLLFPRMEQPGAAARAAQIAASTTIAERTRVTAVRLMERAGPWEQLTALLSVARTATGVVRDTAFTALARWPSQFNRRRSRPSPAELQTLTDALELSRSALPAELTAWLEFSLRPWRR